MPGRDKQEFEVQVLVLIMNGFLLLIPLILIRYGLLWLLNKEALKTCGLFSSAARKRKGGVLVLSNRNHTFIDIFVLPEN